MLKAVYRQQANRGRSSKIVPIQFQVTKKVDHNKHVGHKHFIQLLLLKNQFSLKRVPSLGNQEWLMEKIKNDARMAPKKGR